MSYIKLALLPHNSVQSDFFFKPQEMPSAGYLKERWFKALLWLNLLDPKAMLYFFINTSYTQIRYENLTLSALFKQMDVYVYFPPLHLTRL